jgi:hypothetical protein
MGRMKHEHGWHAPHHVDMLGKSTYAPSQRREYAMCGPSIFWLPLIRRVITRLG